MTETITVPAAEGRAVRLAKGQRLRIVTPKGAQAADFFAYNADSVAEWASCPHTWVTTFSIKLRVGDILLSRFRRPMLKIVEDGAKGCHDMMIAACDQFRYEFFGHKGPHANCADNLMTAMRRLGYEISVVPQPVNFFTHTHIDAEGRLSSPPNPVALGAYVEIEALMDLICVVSACPFDLAVEGWTINSRQGPSELRLEIR